MKKSEIKVNIELDDNRVPETLNWEASDTGDKGECDAIFMSIWDKKDLNTMRIDLWTKEMQVDAMKQFVFQNLMTLADTFERATSESEMANDIRDFSKYFKEKMEL